VVASAQSVNFPFALALPAARALWKLAQTITGDVEPARQKAGVTALEQFQGAYADQFRQRLATSRTNAETVARDLGQAAMNIAQAWADAQHQQQLYRYYAMVKDKRDNRSIAQEVGDWFTGDSGNYGTPPAAPAPPGPPDFAETSIPQATVPGEAPATVC
jgi:hypothetical protein